MQTWSIQRLALVGLTALSVAVGSLVAMPPRSAAATGLTEQREVYRRSIAWGCTDHYMELNRGHCPGMGEQQRQHAIDQAYSLCVETAAREGGRGALLNTAGSPIDASPGSGSHTYTQDVTCTATFDQAVSQNTRRLVGNNVTR